MVKSKGKSKEAGGSKPKQPSDKKGGKIKSQQNPSGPVNTNAGKKSDSRKHSQNDELGDKKKSTHEEIPNEPPPPQTPKTESFKYLAMEPEWNSEEIRNHKLLSDGFTCCIVLVMEDSAELTAMGHYLHHAVKTGVRKRFISVSGEEIAVKVKKFMTSSKIREPGKDDQGFWERMDIWAEAVKQMLMRVKSVVARELSAKEVELTGTRSKDLVRHMPPLPFATIALEPEDPEDEPKQPPPPPPPTAPQNEGDDHHKKKKVQAKLNGDDKRKSINLLSKPVANSEGSGTSSSGTFTTKSRSANMRKRGELPMPTLEEVEDSPTKGPQTYVLMQGFYNPKILEELLKIGVFVDGILLMTDSKVTKRNFSVMDIEDSIPGTFRPHNVLPSYLKFVEQQNDQPIAQRDVVGQFWAGLAELYNTARPDSPLLDCALMNFVLPPAQFGLESPDARGIYASKLFDEASQRIYEMLVLSDWFHDYTASSTIKQIKPVEEELPRLIYENLLNQVPAECVTVPLIMECILEQVVANIDNPNKMAEESSKDNPEEAKKQEDTTAEHKKFGRPDWGNTVVRGGLTALSKRDTDPKNSSAKPVGPTFAPPLYIKNGDYASIRTCHLNETVAAHIASNQVAGDLMNVQGILWQNVPEFNKGLYMKLLGNLNHFMYFLPPESVRFEDMFFILHLLMSAGVEVQLQRQAEKVTMKTDADKKKSNEAKEFAQMVHSTTTQLFSTHGNPDDKNITGTNLDKDHNYLAINEAAGVHFILAPTSANDLSVAPLGHTKEKGNLETPQKDELEEKAIKDKQTKLQETPGNGDDSKRRSVTYDDVAEKNSNKTESSDEKKAREKRSSDAPVKSILNTEKAKQSAGVATNKAIEAAAELVNKENTPVLSGIDEEEEDLEDYTEEEMGERKQQREPDPLKSYYFGEADVQSSKSKRFVACEQEWFKDLNDYSVFQSLLACPALLAINETGALDLSGWVGRYLLSSGLSHASGDGVLIGRLKDWNYVEELVPVQMIQLLNESMENYLSMQRMYCPFYDTLLFIFNNPTPKELKSDTQFYYKLKTLPGLQHFLEYTINDDNVLQWLLGMEKGTGAEIIDSLSVTTLMKIVPEEQWLLVPSIKYILFKEQAKLAELQKHEKAAALAKEMAAEEERKLLENAEKRVSIKEDHTSTESEGPRSNLTDGQEGLKNARKSKVTGKSRKSKAAPPDTPKDGNNAVKIDEETGEKRVSKVSKDEFADDKHNGKRQSKEDSGTKSKKGGKRGSKKSVGSGDFPGSLGSGEPAEKDKLDAIPSFHFNEAIAGTRISSHPQPAVTSKSKTSGPQFDCYDLGKRVIVAASDTYHLFPMDGSVIQYDISTIEPEFRMMQLTITKNGHQTFFYPYYIPHDLDLSTESYVVCPYFHMVHANGTMFSFQDIRAAEAAPYMRVSMKSKIENNTKFSYEKVVFGSEADARKPNQSLETQENIKSSRLKSPASVGPEDQTKNSQATTPRVTVASDEEETNGEEEEEEDGKESGKRDKKSKAKKYKRKESRAKIKLNQQGSDTKIKDEKEKSKKKERSDKKDKKSKKSKAYLYFEGNGEETEEGEEAGEGIPSSPTKQRKSKVGVEDTEWVYSDSEISDDDNGGGIRKKKRNSYYAPNWDEAELTVEPMSHSLKITLPSGLLVQVDDVPGPPTTREVKQSYIARGSATSRIEASRYYTMNGSVVKFMLNGTIQILTARGVTTTIRELVTSAQRDQENLHEAFVSASSVRIFNGDVILPNGDFWHIVNGRKMSHDPIFVFTSGPLPNGEIFRRRQDGVIYLHRHDGTTITHYPDGTRFTTRLVILKDPVKEFEDWVFVGLKYMVEHANYSTVIFNTLSSNLHIRLPQGVWTRVFADGTVKLSTMDNYSMDVDKYKAVLSYPPCSTGNKNIPNLTSVKLWHTKEQGKPDEASSIPESTSTSSKKQASKKKKGKGTEDKGISLGRTSATKIKPSEVNSGSGKKTRNVGRSQRAIPSKENLRTPSKVLSATKSTMEIGVKRRTVEDLDGEVLEEEEMVEEKDMETMISNPIPEEDSNLAKKFEIEEFLQFSGGSLICKAVDSWDNRFAVDIYGETIVDRGDQGKQTDDLDAEELLKSFSEHCQLPQEYVSGILRMTSSDDLATAAKRITALKKLPVETSARLPPTKMFVVKRDMSGYEYFKESQVKILMSRAQGCRDSMVIVDPLPNRDPRKYITIMEPVSEIDKPKGMWVSNYREPMFRPRLLTNKSLHVSKLDDLRWFGYVLMKAHGKRPKFFPNPREAYLKKKVSNLEKPKLIPNEHVPQKQVQSSESVVPIVEVKHEKGKGKDKGSKDASKSLKKEKSKKEKGDQKDRSHSKEIQHEEKHSKKRKSLTKKQAKNGKRESTTIDTEPVTPTSIHSDNPEEEESQEEPRGKPIRLDDTEIGEYPEDTPDLDGIYEDEEPIKVIPQNHADVLSQKKAIVVRSFVEIPQVNEKLQRALLAASMSYGQTVANQVEVFNLNSIQDPRSDEEKEHQKLIKEQLIEQNLSEMHLLEQRSGAVLRFHF